ncbi:MAG: MFS transporter, partial [Firmicutes bacterium]|nr:MFS transporter [Bacillota bacterium]
MEKLRPKAAFGYGICSTGEAAMYTFINSFFLLFLTSVVGMSTDKASMVVSAGLIMEMAGALIVGKMSDSCTSPKGRRRPFLLVSAFMVPIVIFLMYNNYSGFFSENVLLGIYMILNVLFWIGYSIMYVPYIAFGAEIAADYDDRTRLRSMCSAFGVLGSFIGNAAPLMLVSLLLGFGFNDSRAWTGTALIIGIPVGLAIFTGWRCTKGTEQMPEGGKFDPWESIRELPMLLKDFWELMRLKTMKILLVFKIMFNVGYAFFTSSMVFFLQYRLGYGNEVTSTVYSLQIAVNLVTVMIVSWIGIKLGKAGTLRLTMGVAAVGCAIFYLVGIDGYASLMAFIIMFSMASNSFWQLAGAIFYDITEVDEYVYGKRREGAITSLQSGIGSLASAAIISLIGKYLDASGFDAAAAVQPETAMLALDKLFILMPGVCFAVGVAVLFLYPL